MTPFHPVFLRLEGRRAVVIGGGRVAAAKVRELLESGAAVTVVSPSLIAELEVSERDRRITILRRSYQTGDLADAWLAVAATNDPLVNQQVKAEADDRRVWLNAVDDVPNCSFISGSVHRDGEITVAVSTGGACPALAVRLRQLFARLIGPGTVRLARLSARIRAPIARRIPDFETRRRFWYRLVDSELPSLLERGRSGDAVGTVRRLIRDIEHSPSRSRGTVVLVGAGPGDPGLITRAGLAWLRAADVVVYDRLGAAGLIGEARPDARLIDVGKARGQALAGQDEINRILVRQARAGRLVVRLKGGDPFVFGRGGEEIDALRHAGIPFRIVPGVTSAIAAPAAAGIPVTRRGLATSFVVVTGQTADGNEPDWNALARIPTVVVMMGRDGLAAIAERLIAAGKSPDTPAAVIANATLPNQRVASAPLKGIARAASAAGLSSPATLVVGPVAADPDSSEAPPRRRRANQTQPRSRYSHQPNVS